MVHMIHTNEFKFDSMQDCQSIGAYLQSLCEGFSQRQLVLRSEQNEFIVKPHGLLKFEIKAKKKSDRVRVKIEISWKDGDEIDSSDSLVITGDPHR
jgi:amphi-Trp domain-containing protein